jgi:hypothetical protein
VRVRAQAQPAPLRPLLRLAVAPRTVRAGVRTRFRFRLTTSSGRPVRGALIRFAGERAHTGRRGRAALVTRLERPGRYAAVALKRGHRAATGVRASAR